ncbi:MAG: YjjG family noncanonical pyrimidine nucleotidase [Paenibacillaceae bacterium]|uniref:YjjG family noncanonical pyrimidine nucleotidase n=1 Tax=Paenibacillus mellifer TaxID=2937794 RepID=A0A9X1Y1L9_9BACL|nr:YjjG family noncanonical pyrimidine nucleotidase [Paenibacillus mellifer]MBW4840989.1 YjjG family noncanonical pyrimidine nucleotidase [Paenibacillaceae bacterium]MCK8487688.1 YjjG family noncanonical pyrimidine nucleotidase [Paenibacillus mellifer]
MIYTHILFDADDTLYDYPKAENHALNRTLTEAGIACTGEVMRAYQAINQQLWRDLEQGLVTQAALRTERFSRLFQELGLTPCFQVEEISERYLGQLGQGIFLIDGAYELCRDLNEAGVHLAILTNGIKKVQTSRIAGSELAEMFEAVIVSEDTGYQKPHPGIFDYAFDILGLRSTDKSRVLIVGDSLTSDMKGGFNYGIDTCWFNPFRRPNTLDLQTTYEIHRLEEVKELTGVRNGESR